MNRRIVLGSLAAIGFWATGAVAHQRDRAMDTMHHGMHRSAAAKLEVRDDPGAHSLTVRIGPLDLPAHTGHMAAAQPRNLFLTIPFDGWLTAYSPRMVDGGGQALPGKLLHHVAFWNTARSDWLCPHHPEHIFGAGGEMNEWPALPGFGYRVDKGTRIRISTMVHNPTDSYYRDAYLEVRLDYRLAAPGDAGLRNIYPTWLDVMTCGESTFDLEPGKNVNTARITVPDSGVLLGVGGHLHDYGQRLVLTNVARGETIATLDATQDSQGRLLSIPVVRFIDRGGYRLAKGDIIQVEATYDNPTGKPLPESAMAIVVGYFLPDSDSRMGQLVRNNKSRGQ